MRDPAVFERLQERLGVIFRRPELLEQSLRHRSVAADSPRDSNERLEFLGDSVVGLVVCELLYARFPDASEGDLAKRKAYLASEPVLAAAGESLGLADAIEMSSGEEASGGRRRRSILADAFEAVVAAIYMDQGIRTARRIVRAALSLAIADVVREDYHRDYKSQLQEITQANSGRTPLYRIHAETGADHDKTFVAHALLGRKILGEGQGKSKKEAEQAAARAAIETMA